ncbi:MAG: adenylate cyclase [Deltaproteobacteria bacterium]|nr:MAG: adenylate cyclase [Deltaproteobacteria bacterium]
MSLEQEAKFILTDTEACRIRIIDMGGRSKGRVFETNVCYEDEKNSLAGKKSILRLRQDRIVRLTHKSPPAGENREVKAMNEIEVSVSDFNAMDQILRTIGFHPAQTYEKWRETFLLDGAELCLDTMPFGDFLEIEGTPDQVKSISAALALSWEKRILANYLSIFAMIKEKEPLTFNDITFDNFKSRPVELNRYAAMIEAGA